MTAGAGRAEAVTLARLGGLRFRALKVAQAVWSGLHRDPAAGATVEFADYRPYVPGDDVRTIDWKVYARRERFFVRRYEDERGLVVYFLVDTSGSMGFAGHPDTMTKGEYAAVCAAALAHLLVRQSDAPGLLLFADLPGSFVPARALSEQFGEIAHTLETASFAGTTDLDAAAELIAARAPRRSALIVLSDLFVPRDRLIGTLARLAAIGFDLSVFHLLDRREISFDYETVSDFFDPEAGGRVTVDPGLARRDYLRAMERFRRETRQALLAANIDVTGAVTDEPPDRPLVEFLRRRQNRRR